MKRVIYQSDAKINDKGIVEVYVKYNYNYIVSEENLNNLLIRS